MSVNNKINRPIYTAKAFVERLKLAMAGRTQAAFARELGIAPQQLTRYLSGRIPDPAILARMAALTGRSVDWLLTGREISDLWRDLASMLEQVRAYDPHAAGGSLAESSAEYARLHGLVDRIEADIEKQEAARGLAVDPAAKRLFESYQDLNAEERDTLARCAEALRDGQADVRNHLIGQLKLIEDTVRLRKARAPSGPKRAGAAS